jgi:hypothetical protein
MVFRKAGHAFSLAILAGRKNYFLLLSCRSQFALVLHFQERKPAKFRVHHAILREAGREAKGNKGWFQ